MSSQPDQVLQAFIKKYGQVPEQPNQLVSFSRTNPEVPTIIYSEAKKALSKIKKAIKSGTKKKSFKKIVGGNSAKWMVGDEVLISKDRTGILKYIGKVPEMGDDKIWYGLELTSGTMGQHDGSIKGKRYFQTNGKRGMFIPEHKLRRRLNRKDKERRNSYMEISNQVKQLQKEYAGDDAAILYPSSQFTQTSVDNKENDNDINNNISNALNTHQTMEDIHALVFENPERTPTFNNQSATFYQEPQQKSSPSPHRDVPSPIRTKNKKKKTKTNKKKVSRNRTGSSGSSTSQSSRGDRYYSRNNNVNNNHHYNNNKHNDDDDDDDDDIEDESRSDLSDLDEDDSSPTVKTFDTLLKYILRQKGQYREGLLDVYGNPQTHPLIVEAFSQMKQLQPNEQAFLWPALLKRWSKYTHKI